MKRSRLSRKCRKLTSARLMRLPLPAVKEITLTRWEGRHEECMKPITVKSFAEANKVLDQWRQSPSTPAYGGGYDKVGFKIVFANGDKYDGRYDLNKDNDRGYADQPTLEAHIVAIQKYYSKV